MASANPYSKWIWRGEPQVAVAASQWYAAMYTILVADDDWPLLTVVAQILAEPGHIVLTAADGFEAVRILGDRHVDLMITDVRMPGLDGLSISSSSRAGRSATTRSPHSAPCWRSRSALPRCSKR